MKNAGLLEYYVSKKIYNDFKDWKLYKQDLMSLENVGDHTLELMKLFRVVNKDD